MSLSSDLVYLLAVLAGGLGAVCRFVVDSWVNKHNRLSFPVGTIVVNVTACFLLGLVTGFALSHVGSGSVTFKLIVGTGFLGGYSTFSTASVEGYRQLEAGKPMQALIHTGGMLLASIGTGLLGLALTM